MIKIEDGYEVAYDLAQVLARAEAAVAADPHAAIDLATDGSCLRFTAGDPAVVVALGEDAPPEGDVGWMRQEPLAHDPGCGGCSTLESMRATVADGGTRLRFMRKPHASTGWIMTTNTQIDRRQPPYDVPERYMVLSAHAAILDLETGLFYREGPGRRMLQARPEVLRELCARLNAEASGRISAGQTAYATVRHMHSAL
ncbi:hypothetical protein [Microtetraspora malaysiensis]|uniref:Uncharacterized protein n=1 Tax=Microtetraspora malaysiensis TaxID=161358 RepID=A0ABW6SMN5_9ACTN